ncbi:hypothetical protein ACIO6U_33700 [Streptomyces sp. NPDC087422]|uniref:hypothetical protein n=1 Tax=Streptomyces sp. NPDC087422 TaxID=3365786 RepID=UPI00382E478C
MRGRAFTGRLRPTALALGAAGVLTLGGGAVAFGADGPPTDTAPADSIDLGLRAYDVTFAPTAAGAEPVTRSMAVTMFHHDPNVAVPAQRLTFSAAGMKNVAEVVWPQGCTVTGADAVCTVPGAPVGRLDLPDVAVKIRPLPGVAAGAKGSFSVSHRNTNGKTQTFKPTVTLADGPSLVVGRAAATTLAPGANGDVPVTVTNEGNADVASVQLELRWSHGLTPVERFSNCVYDTSRDPRQGVDRTVARCAIDQPLAAGASYGVRDTVSVKANADAYAESVDVTAFTPKEATAHPAGEPGTGPALHLVPVPGGTPGADGRNDTSYGGADFTVTNTADFGISAPEVTGANGAQVKLTVHVDNHGPASIDPLEYFTPVTRFDVRVPDGTALVEWPVTCAPRDTAKRYLRCASDTESDVERPVTLYSGKSYDFPLTLRVTSTGVHRGEAALLTTGPNRIELPFDHNAANNTVALVVKTSASNASATAGSSGSSGSNGTTGSAGSSGAVSGGAGNASLPATGAGATRLIGGIAVGAVAFGGAVLFTARNRRRTA